MGDSPTSSRTSMSYEDTWNTNETIDSDIWNECDDPTPEVPEDTPALEEQSEDSDETITENEENPLSSESAIFETPIASQLLESPNMHGEAEEVAVTDIPSNQSYDVPPGKYRLVGWNLNMTGNRLIDEICQISGYTPKERFNLFVMPHGNPNNYIREHYGLQISTSGAYRTLRDIISRRFLKTRSDVSALTEFIAWLEKIKGDKDGVVLIFHDIKKLVPLKMLQCLKRFNLLEKFKNVVKGFCNICTLAESKTGETKYLSLKVLSNVLLLQRNNNRRGGFNKARTCHEILVELLLGAHNCALYTNLNRKTTKRMSDAELIRQVCENIVEHLEHQANEQKRKNSNASEVIYKYSVTVNSEEVMLMKFEELLERQNSFRAVFKDLMNFDHPTRQIINRVRRKIVNQHYSFKDVENAWNDNKYHGLEEFFNSVDRITKKEFDLITEVFERHFDPELETYLDILVSERNSQNKKAPTKQEVKDDLEKSFVKLPKIVEDDGDSVKEHRRVKSL